MAEQSVGADSARNQLHPDMELPLEVRFLPTPRYGPHITVVPEMTWRFFPGVKCLDWKWRLQSGL